MVSGSTSLHQLWSKSTPSLAEKAMNLSQWVCDYLSAYEIPGEALPFLSSAQMQPPLQWLAVWKALLYCELHFPN